MSAEPGQMLSHYRLVEKIGEGGMGVVWKADDTVLHRKVAIKVLPAELALDDAHRRMFLDEARLAASVSHGNIVQVHELGREEALDFIVMEYVEGKPLSKLLQGRPLPADKIADWGLQMATGLARAHRRQLIHRDLKPANILVTPDGEVKIVDFGLATLFTPPDSTLYSMTKTLIDASESQKQTSVAGTLPYMSPEQVRGEKLDARSDIFSFGSVLYEMTTGRRPFLGAAARDVAQGILESRPVSVPELVPDVPVDLHRIIEKSMAPRPADRYQHMDDLAVDLKRLVRDLDSGSSPSYASVRRGRQRRRWLPAMVVIVAAVFVGVAAYLKRPRAKSEPASGGAEQSSVAVVDFRNLANPEDEASSATLTSLVEFGLIERLENSPCHVVALDYLKDLRRRRFGSTTGPLQPEQALDVAREAGATMLILGDIAKRGEDYLVIWRLVDTRGGEALGARRAQGADYVVLADSTAAGVVSLLASFCAVEASSATRSVAAMTTASPEAYRHYLAALAAEEQGQWEVRERELEQSIALDSTFALAHFELGNLDRAWELRSHLSVKDRFRLDAAREERLVDKVDIYREIQSRWPDDLRGLRDFGSALFNAWSFDEAAVILSRATRLYPDDANLTTSYWQTLHCRHRHREAIESVRRYLQRDPGNSNMWANIGLSFLALGLPDSAETHFLRALEIDPELYRSHRGLAWCAYARGHLARAIEIDEENLRSPHILDSQRRDTMTFSMHGPGLANYYYEAGRFDEAFATQDRGRSHAKDRRAIHDYLGAYALLIRGRTEEATHVANDLSSHDLPYIRYLSSLLRCGALVAVDSLDAARAIVDGWPALTPTFGGVVDYTIKWFTAEIALREDDPESALDLMQQIQKKGNPWGENNIRFRENLAKAHRMADQHDEAAAVLQELLHVYPGHALAHYQLGAIYEEMGRPREAEAAYHAFLEAWATADHGLPEVRQARERLESLRHEP